MSDRNKGYEFTFMLDERRMTETVYAQDYFAAKSLLESKYGSNIKGLNGTGKTFKSQYDLNREQEEAEEKRQNQLNKQMKEQERKLQELEAKTSNIAYQQQAENLKNEIENIFPNVKEWEEYKLSLENEINEMIIKIRKKIDEFSEYSSSLHDAINAINTKIDEHNNQPNIYDSNKIDPLKNIDDTLNTEIDFNKKADEDLGLGGWIFIILILALILYGVDWFFDLNIYLSVYEFIKNLFGNKT